MDSGRYLETVEQAHHIKIKAQFKAIRCSKKDKLAMEILLKSARSNSTNRKNKVMTILTSKHLNKREWISLSRVDRMLFRWTNKIKFEMLTKLYDAVGDDLISQRIVEK